MRAGTPTGRKTGSGESYTGGETCIHVFRYTITVSLTLDRVCWSSSHHLPTFVRRSLQPRSSATAGHECRGACASCLCLSACLTNPIFVSALPVIAYKSASTCLPSGISSRVTACLSESALDAFSARDRRNFLQTLAASATAQRSHICQPQLKLSFADLLLSAAHICPLRRSSRSVCLRIAFECHFGVINHCVIVAYHDYYGILITLMGEDWCLY